MKMKFSKFLVFAGLAALLTFFTLGADVLAFETNNDPPALTEGPELWGVIVIDCNVDVATLRVKKIDDCEVNKQAEVTSWTASCPQSDSNVLYYRFPAGINLFSIGKQAVITKVRNWEVEESGTRVSFDAQIKFLPVP
jgi:hypothetical protein